MFKNKSLVLFSEGLHYTGMETLTNEHHGNMIKFIQAFPHPLLGHTTESVAIREQDIDKVIEFLQSLKGVKPIQSKNEKLKFLMDKPINKLTIGEAEITGRSEEWKEYFKSIGN